MASLKFNRPVLIYFNMLKASFVSMYCNYCTIILFQQEFHVQGTGGLLLTDAHFILEKAVVARRLRFYINGGVPDPSHRLCWEVMLFGCTLLEGESIPYFITSIRCSHSYSLPKPHKGVLKSKQTIQ